MSAENPVSDGFSISPSSRKYSSATSFICDE
jgi:hypothetical protein